jgi:hypothetical protein
MQYIADCRRQEEGFWKGAKDWRDATSNVVDLPLGAMSKTPITTDFDQCLQAMQARIVPYSGNPVHNSTISSNACPKM